MGCARRPSFSEGIYHGAALSAVSDAPSLNVHLVYKDLTERMFYRYWNGSSWSARQVVDDAQDWATQAATTRVGNDVMIFWNHPVATNTDYRLLAIASSAAARSGPWRRSTIRRASRAT